MKDIIININKFIYNDKNGNLIITNIDNFKVDKLFINGKFVDFTGTITLDLLNIVNNKREFKISKESMFEKDLFNLVKVFIDNKIYFIKDIYRIDMKKEPMINNKYLVTLKIESESYYKEKNKNNDRNIKYPKLYKHFKGDIYCTRFISYPISFTDFADKYNKELKANKRPLHITCLHTETNKDLVIFRIENKYYHNKESEKENLVIYNCINNIEKTYNYARPVYMFLSKVDKEKYPDVEQKYRFEEI